MAVGRRLEGSGSGGGHDEIEWRASGPTVADDQVQRFESVVR